MSAWAVAVFRAMSSRCRVVANDHDHTVLGEAMIHDLERRWSPSLPSSEISALNRAAGDLCALSDETYELVSCAEQARIVTDGAFNPLMPDHLIAIGCDGSWETVLDADAALLGHSPASAAPIELFPEIKAVRLPFGTRFDPGGVGKGLVADMVVRSLLGAGATSVQVELGGDVCVAGPEWSGGVWRVHVDDGFQGVSDAATISLREGGVATSSVIRRRWRRGSREVHHLIDPATGLPAVTDLEAVTAVATRLWWAEVVAKVALMAGSAGGRRILQRFGTTGLLVRPDPMRRYEVVTGSGHAA